MPALHHIGLVQGHVIAQVIKAHFIIRTIGDIAVVGRPPLIIAEPVHNEADTEAEEAMNLPHPFAVAACKVVVDGNNVHAFTGQGIQVCRKNRNQSFSFAGLHLGDSALMQDNSADNLYREGLHPEHAPRGLSRRGKSVGKDIVQCLPVGKTLLQSRCLPPKLFVG